MKIAKIKSAVRKIILLCDDGDADQFTRCAAKIAKNLLKELEKTRV